MPIWCYYIVVALAIPGAIWSTICVFKEIHKWRKRKTQSGSLIASSLEAPISQKEGSQSTLSENSRASEKLEDLGAVKASIAATQMLDGFKQILTVIDSWHPPPKE